MSRLRSLFVPMVLVAVGCASAVGGGDSPRGDSSPTKPGPGVADLSGFITPLDFSVTTPAPDMATPIAVDMKAPADMATAPADMAQPADMATGGGGGCGSVTVSGYCSGDILTYCDPSTNKVVNVDCWWEYYTTCYVDSSGYADCYY